MPAARSLPVVVVLVGSLLLAACTATGDAAGPTTTSALAGASTRAAAPAGARPGSLANPRQADCGNRLGWVPGEATQPYRPGRDDVVVGPLAIGGLRVLAHARLGQYGEDPWYKAGVLVQAGHTATVSIPPEVAGMAGLHYTKATDNARTPAEADQAVRFTSCGFNTPFIGGFLVKAPRCVPIQVRPDGRAPVRVVLSFSLATVEVTGDHHTDDRGAVCEGSRPARVEVGFVKARTRTQLCRARRMEPCGSDSARPRG